MELGFRMLVFLYINWTQEKDKYHDFNFQRKGISQIIDAKSSF